MTPFLALITPIGDTSGGGSPPGIWGGGNVPMPNPPIHLPPGSPPGIWGGGNVPMPNPPIHMPPGIWGGGNVPMPTPPIHMPPGGSGAHPEHPIYYPLHPEHPIVLPPVEEGGEERRFEVGVVWTPETGWQTVLVPTVPVPVPSR